MKRGAMDHDSAERYFNNLCTQAPDANYDIDGNTETENSGTDSENSDVQIFDPNISKKYEEIPINIHCATVNFESDNTNHLAVSGINTSSPDRNTNIKNIVSPSTNEKNAREYSAVETNTYSLLSPTSTT